MSELVGRRFVDALAARDEPALPRSCAGGRRTSWCRYTPAVLREPEMSTASSERCSAVGSTRLTPWRVCWRSMSAFPSSTASGSATGSGCAPRGSSAAYEMEQQAYYTCQDDRIVWLRVMCTGWRPMPAED